GYGKRTRVADYPVKGRGGMGVKTVQLSEAKGYLVGSRVVRDGYQVMLISTGGTVIRMSVEDIRRMGRATQGVIVMRLRDGEAVSSRAPVVESDNGANGEAEDVVAEPAAAIEAEAVELEDEPDEPDETDETDEAADEEPEVDDDEE